MTDQYYDGLGTFIGGGAHGQPDTTAGWNTPGGNQLILPQQIAVATPLQQEYEIELPPIRVDYVDVQIKGKLANATYAAATWPGKYLVDYITRFRITDGSKNTPIDCNGVELRAIAAMAAPKGCPSVYRGVLLSSQTGAATTGEIDVMATIRIYGPFQLSYMNRPTLKIQIAVSDATTVGLKIQASVLASDVQIGDDALGYYYVSESRAYVEHNEFAMGSSMVQDILIATGQTTFGADAATLKRIATANVAANQKILWEDQAIFEELASNAALNVGPGCIASMGNIDNFALVTTGSTYTGAPMLIEHVDIAHNLNRKLIIDRVTGGSGSTFVVFRNQVLG